MANAVRIVIEAVDKTKVGLTTPIRNLKDLQSAVTKLGPAMKAMSLAAAGAFALFAKSSFNAAEEMRKMNNMLSVATGSMEGAAKEMDFVSRISDDLGLNLKQAARGFAGIAAAANGTSLEGQKVRDVYEGVSTAVAALSLSADDTRGVMTALTQIISKGTVSSDELKQQLGERLPGAFQIAARSMGITTEEMSKLLEQGKIVAADFLPAFAEELKKTFGPAAQTAAQSYTANVARLKNQFFLLQVEVGQQLLPEMVALTGAFSDWLKEGSNSEDLVSGFVAIMKTLKDVVIQVITAFDVLGDVIGSSLGNALNKLQENAKKIENFLLTHKQILIALNQAYADAELGNFQGSIDEFNAAVSHTKRLLEDIVDTSKDFADGQNDALKDGMKTWEQWQAIFNGAKEDVYGPIEPPGSKKYNDDPLDAMGIPTYLKAPSFNVETQSKEEQKIVDSANDAWNKLYNTKEELLYKELQLRKKVAQETIKDTIVLGETISTLNSTFMWEVDALMKESAEAEMERQQKISDLRFELGQAGLDAETEQAEILENLREQQYQNDLARIESLKLEEAEARELKAAAEKALANQAKVDAIAAAKKADEIQKHRERVFQQSLGNMASASAAFFGEQSGAYKAFAISEALVNTYRGANQTLADPDLPFFLKAFAVASIIASGLANVAQISGVAHGGIAEVPSDQTFLLKQGERVLSPDQNEDFTEFIGDGRGGGGGMMNLTINLDGQPLYSGISKASKDGRFTISARAVS